MKTILLILSVSTATVISQLILKKGVGELSSASGFFDLARLAICSPLVILSLCLQGFSFFLWVAVLSKANLGYAFGISGAFFYILLPLLSWLIFGERLGPVQWGGLVLITLGVVCVVSNLEFLR
jgi:multidrug transporter EmrE-like cation transporter